MIAYPPTLKSKIRQVEDKLHSRTRPSHALLASIGTLATGLSKFKQVLYFLTRVYSSTAFYININTFISVPVLHKHLVNIKNTITYLAI